MWLRQQRCGGSGGLNISRGLVDPTAETTGEDDPAQLDEGHAQSHAYNTICTIHMGKRSTNVHMYTGRIIASKVGSAINLMPRVMERRPYFYNGQMSGRVC